MKPIRSGPISKTSICRYHDGKFELFSMRVNCVEEFIWIIGKEEELEATEMILAILIGLAVRLRELIPCKELNKVF